MLHASSVSGNQLGFMPDRSKIETNFVLSQMMEQFQVNKRNLYIEFIDLEKINDRVPRSVI